MTVSTTWGAALGDAAPQVAVEQSVALRGSHEPHPVGRGQMHRVVVARNATAGQTGIARQAGTRQTGIGLSVFGNERLGQPTLIGASRGYPQPVITRI